MVNIFFAPSRRANEHAMRSAPMTITLIIILV